MFAGASKTQEKGQSLRFRWRIGWIIACPFVWLFPGLRVFGREKLVKGPQILAVNHVSNIDPLVVGCAAARELHFLAKEELFRPSLFFAWLIRNFNAWPVRRGIADTGAIRHCSRILRYGQSLVLFPEGTRSQTGEIGHFMRGVGMLAITNRVPVVPTFIQGLDKSWISWFVDRDFVKKGFRKRSVHRTKIRVFFGEPVYPENFSRDRRGYVEMTRAVEERVRTLGKCQG
ncbi:hypothetical protein CH330_04665 [candidate division WOR-3 bacterium JGI_Cruoil_03_51_56]|uniref:Phospholipid/glycerol acyltransferase domain-containing protein n=1 Tax=candidate division WOR-3 bacterium JGI_Cruoil_03_51_56 TaxID=1973747 RepID=A0A235BW79_UNCW3|nr:MAG: hypothetical protein CH330_04665 [candidate division WOR-3 bacterium JGI_Cruoil_03_51_56]